MAGGNFYGYSPIPKDYSYVGRAAEQIGHGVSAGFNEAAERNKTKQMNNLIREKIAVYSDELQKYGMDSIGACGLAAKTYARFPGESNEGYVKRMTEVLDPKVDKTLAAQRDKHTAGNLRSTFANGGSASGTPETERRFLTPQEKRDMIFRSDLSDGARKSFEEEMNTGISNDLHKRFGGGNMSPGEMQSELDVSGLRGDWLTPHERRIERERLLNSSRAALDAQTAESAVAAGVAAGDGMALSDSDKLQISYKDKEVGRLHDMDKTDRNNEARKKAAAIRANTPRAGAADRTEERYLNALKETRAAQDRYSKELNRLREFQTIIETGGAGTKTTSYGTFDFSSAADVKKAQARLEKGILDLEKDFALLSHNEENVNRLLPDGMSPIERTAPPDVKMPEKRPNPLEGLSKKDGEALLRAAEKELKNHGVKNPSVTDIKNKAQELKESGWKPSWKNSVPVINKFISSSSDSSMDDTAFLDTTKGQRSKTVNRIKNVTPRVKQVALDYIKKQWPQISNPTDEQLAAVIEVMESGEIA